VAVHEEYNLTGEDEGFAIGAPKYLVYREVAIPEPKGALDLDGKSLVPFLDKKTGWGTLRVFCELTDGHQTFLSNMVCLSRFSGSGYTGKLTEIFNLPYIYGSALLRIANKPSADARFGADCSSFIIYGRRRQGWNIPYVNPKDLLPFLEPIDEFIGFKQGIAYGRLGPIVMTPELLANGLLLHFGRHVAAVYQNDDGVLKENTSVAHQLETYPEITTFGLLARRYKEIRIMTFKSSP